MRYVPIAGGLDGTLADWPRDAPAGAVAAEPAPERAQADLGAWLANLEAARIDVLFVAVLYPGVREAMPHDDAGFPIERVWADARPDELPLGFANEGVRIYWRRPAPTEARRP